MSDKNHYVAVVTENGYEFFKDNLRITDRLGDFERDTMASEAVRKSGLITARKNPRKTEVKLFELVIENGKLNRQLVKTFNIDVPLHRMENEEFEERQTEELTGIPEEFHAPLKRLAWEEGHSSGMECVISCLTELVSNIQPAIVAFEKRIKKSVR